MKISMRRVVWAVVAAAVVGGVAAAGGFLVGLRWPLEGLEERLGLRTHRFALDWRPLARTELPRYENLRLQIGDTLYLFGGFHRIRPGTFEPDATPRVLRLHLGTGEVERLGDMPTPLTHAAPALVGDTVWIAGGFVGNHPGPATDEVWRYHRASDSWTPGPPLPAPRGGGALLARSDTLHLFGGYLPDRDTDSQDHWTLAPGDSIWREAPALPLPRGHLAGLELGGDLYALSGNRGHDPVPVDVPDVHRYDAGRRTWETMTPLPFPLSHAEPATSPYEGGIVMVGGRARIIGRENLDDVVFYDPAEDRWIHLGRMPLELLGATAAVVGDSLVAGWGAEFGNRPRNTAFWKTALRNSWRRIDTLPVPLAGAGAARLGHRFVAVGGDSPRSWVFDTAWGRWNRGEGLPDRPAPGRDHAVEVVDGDLILLGGTGRHAEGRVQILDDETGRWGFGPELPEPVGNVASARLEGRILVAGGARDGRPVALAAAWTPGSPRWEGLPELPRPRSGASGGSDGRRFFVFGGRDARGRASTDVQIFDPVTGRWVTSGEGAASPAPLPLARADAGRAVYLDGEFWVIGGEGPDARATARVDIYDPDRDVWRPGPELRVPRRGAAEIPRGGRIYLVGGTDVDGLATGEAEMVWPRR